MKHFWRQPTSVRQPPRTPRGYRAYAVGDVHGRLDLLLFFSVIQVPENA